MKNKFLLILTLTFTLTLVGIPKTSNAIMGSYTSTPINTKKIEKRTKRVWKKIKQGFKKKANAIQQFFKNAKENDNAVNIIWTIFILGLTGTFIALKILGTITWSWLWVLSPLWIPLALLIVIAIIALIVVLIAAAAGA